MNSPAHLPPKTSKKSHTEVKPVGPNSYTWKDFGSYIYLLVLPEALVLQAAHPVVNSAVTTTQKYRTDPWGRAETSLKMLWPVVYSRPKKAIENGRAIREWHRPLKGVDKHGKKYHALDPEAYAWVHMTGFDAMIRMHRFFVDEPLSDKQRADMFAEWQQMGHMVGVDPRQIPETEKEYWQAYNRMIEESLVHTEVLDHALSLTEFVDGITKPDSLKNLPDSLWKAMFIAPAFFYGKLIAATLPENFRKRFGVKYSKLDDTAFKMFAWGVRKIYPRLPEKRRYIPLAWRSIKDARHHPEAYAM